MECVVIREELREKLQGIGEADLLIGVPSFNSANTIRHVVQAVQVGVAKYFPEKRAVLINSDGGSTDGTREVVEQAVIEDFQPLLINQRRDLLSKIVTPYHGISGKGSAFRTVFEVAKELKVKACAVIDSDLRSITPEWIDLLIRPVLERSYDFVAPFYLRHKYDGTITNSIVYPLTAALYGQRIRQPIGGDFGFSGELAKFYLTKDVWETDVARFGIDIWMTTTAVANGFRICQSFLGAKIHAAKDPSADLPQMLAQVVSSLFMLMEEHEPVWKNSRGMNPVPIFGFRYDVGVEPVNVNLERMISMFRLGLKELGDLWKEILEAETLSGLIEAAGREPFRIDDALWGRVLYDFSLAWHRKVLSREHILSSLTPLYLGKVASFVGETERCSAREVEEKLEALCCSMEEMKPYLIERWR